MHKHHVFVTAGKGRTTPIHPTEATAPGASMLFVREGKTYRVPFSSHTRRSLKNGDLVLVNRDGTTVKTAKDADASASEHQSLDYHLDGSILPPEVATPAMAAPAAAATMQAPPSDANLAAPAPATTTTKGA